MRLRTFLFSAALAASVLSTVAPATAASAAVPKWTKETIPAGGSWYAVAYNHGLWVAAGRQAWVMTSTNGTSWTKRTTPPGSWQSLAYGDGKWVSLSSVGGSENEMTSTNGTTWVATTAPDQTWSSVVYAGGRFVAVSFDGNSMTSTDGVTWSTPVAVTGSFYAIAYGAGVYVAVDDGGAGGAIIRSTDGVHWTYDPLPLVSHGGWGAVAYGNGEFLAFDGNGNNAMLTSTDGVTWTRHGYPHPTTHWSGTFGCNVFATGGSAYTNTASDLFGTSALGTSWTQQPTFNGANANWAAVGWGPGRFVAVSDSSNAATLLTPGPCAQQIPNPPTNVRGTAGAGTITARWAAPHVVGSSPVSSYVVKAVSVDDHTATHTCVTTATTCAVTGLVPDDTYAVSVVALNKSGASAPSGPVDVINPIKTTFTLSLNTFLALADNSVFATVTGAAPNHTVSVTGALLATSCTTNSFGQCTADLITGTGGVETIAARYTLGSVHALATSSIHVANLTYPLTGSIGTTAEVDIANGMPHTALTIVGTFTVTHASTTTTFTSGPITTVTDSSGAASDFLVLPNISGGYLMTITVSDDGLELTSIPLLVS